MRGLGCAYLVPAMKKVTSFCQLPLRCGLQKWRRSLPSMERPVDLVSQSLPPLPRTGAVLLEAPRAVNVLCDLPDDVLFLILYELDVYSLLRCKQVCRVLKHLIDGSERLTYTVELAINGMVDGPSTPGRSVHKRLQALRQYNAQVYASASTGVEDVEEYEGSRWSKLQKAAARGGCCPTAYVIDQGRTLVVNEPRFAQGSLEVRRRIVPLEPGMALVAVDMSQDLLVLYRNRSDDLGNKGVHLRSLGALVSTAHPGATLAVLEDVPFSEPAVQFGNHDGRRTSIMDAQIQGSYVAWKVPYDDGETTYSLEVWDWKKGILAWHGRFSSLSISTYTFIDMEHLAVELWGRKVVVYRFSSHEIDSTRPSFNITDQPSVAAVDIKDTTPLFSLELFPHSRDCCIVEPSLCTISRLPPPSALFWPDPSLRMIAVQFHLSSSPKLRKLLGDSLNSTFVVLIPQSTFREHLGRASTRTEADGPLRVPWRDWGEHGSVVLRSGTFPEQPHLAGLYANSRVIPFGSRVSVFSLDSAGEVRSKMVDLNPGRVLMGGPTAPRDLGIKVHSTWSTSQMPLAVPSHISIQHILGHT